METKAVWTIQKILDWTKQYFAGKGLESPRLDAEILLCDVLNCQRIRLYVNFDQPLQEAELAKYRGYVLRRAAWEPLAYILGHREFMDLDFKVTPAVLIPRPETELLVEKLAQACGRSLHEPKKEIKVLPWNAEVEARARAEAEERQRRALEEQAAGDRSRESHTEAAMAAAETEAVMTAKATEGPAEKAAEKPAEYGTPAGRVLDIGTGSGAIIIALLSLVPTLRGTALDKSRAALAVAKANAAHLLGLEALEPVEADSKGGSNRAPRLSFLESDVWAAVPRGSVYDIIVSNPPYIPAADMAGLAADVLKEPEMALVGGTDGLAFYRAIIQEAPKHLAAGGILAFEVGIGQAEAVAELCRAVGLTDTLICKDYSAIDRMVFAAAPGSVLLANIKEGQ